MTVMRALKGAGSLLSSYADVALCGSGEQQQCDEMHLKPLLEQTLEIHNRAPVDALVMVTDLICSTDIQGEAALLRTIKENGIKVFTCSNFYDRLRDEKLAPSIGSYYLQVARQADGIFAPFTLREPLVLHDYLMATGLAIAGRKLADFRFFSSQISTPQGAEFLKACCAKYLRATVGTKNRIIPFAPRPPA